MYPQPGAFPPPPPAAPSWFSRNWKWFVPVVGGGCLLALVAFVVGIVMLVFGMMRNMEPYPQSVAKARADARVVAALGEPIKEGWIVSGSIKLNGGNGTARLSIPIYGPKASGTLYVNAQKSAGKWAFQTLEVEVPGTEKRIDLR